MVARPSPLKLNDYSRCKACIQQHAPFGKTRRETSQHSLTSEEGSIELTAPMTLQDFRENMYREDEGVEQITFVLRVSRKRMRDGSSHLKEGSTHSASKPEKDIAGDRNRAHGEYEPRTPGRTSSNRSRLSRNSSGTESLGTSTEEISAFGSPSRMGRRPSGVSRDVKMHCPSPVLSDLWEGSDIDQSPSYSSYSGTGSPRREGKRSVFRPGKRGTKNEEGQKHPLVNRDTSTIALLELDSSTDSMIFRASGSDTSMSCSVASSCASGSISGSISRSWHGGKNQPRNQIMPAHLQQSYASISEDGSDPKTPLRRAGSHANACPTQSPSDNDESFTCIAQKYSRFVLPPVEALSQDITNASGSAIDLNESFSSIASFAEDDEFGTEERREPRGLLEGSDNSEEEEDELSLGDQSPDSVAIDLTSVSTSLNSKSLSTASSSKASRSIEKSNASPANDVKTIRTHKRRNEGGDANSVGSALSKVSNHSTGSWYSRHSKAKSTSSRFSRLEEYLNNDSTHQKNTNGSKDSNSKFSLERKDDISTTSSITMGTFQTSQTRDSELKKLSDVVESDEFFQAAAPDSPTHPAAHLKSNPFLAADRRNNLSVQTTHTSPKKASLSPPKGPMLEVFEEDDPMSPVKQSSQKAMTSIMNPTGRPGKLNLDQLGPFASSNKNPPDVARFGRFRPGVGLSKSAETPGQRPTVLDQTKTSDVALEISSPVSSNKVPLKKRSSHSASKNGSLHSSTRGSSHSSTRGSSHSGSSMSKSSSHVRRNSLSSSRHKKADGCEKSISKTPASNRLEDLASPTNSGINLFHPSAHSPRSKKKVPGKLSWQPMKSTSSAKDNAEANTDRSVDGSVTSQLSKVQSYLKKMREQNSNQTGNDLSRVATNLTKNTSRKKGNWKGTIHAVVQKSSIHKGQSVETSETKVKSSGKNPDNQPAKKSLRRGGPSLGNFLEQHNNTRDSDEQSFQEPGPSPWRPTDQGGRIRTRHGDGTCSVASSKCSVSSRRTGTLSIFQPHKITNTDETDDDAVNHTPEREPISLVEQRKRMFQSNATKTTSHRPSLLKKITNATTTDDSSSYNGSTTSLELPTAPEICGRVSSWHTDALLRMG